MIRTFCAAIAVFASTQALASIEIRLAPDTTASRFVRETFDGGKHEVFVSGEIDSNSAAQFVQFVDSNRIHHAIVVFDSPGGSLIGGIKLGKAIRDRGFDTAIGTMLPDGALSPRGLCASSCAYAFAGGRYRHYTGDEQRLGIHQFYADGDNQADIGETQIVGSFVLGYLREMGVDAQAFVVASRTPGDEMFWLSADQATDLGLANNGADPTTVEIMLAGSMPYLKLEQARSNVTMRVLFGCENSQLALSAGIVVTPALAAERGARVTKSYLEDGQGQFMVVAGVAGAEAVDSVLWLNRRVSPSDLRRFLEARQLGVWTENGSHLRWGGAIDMRPAREKLAYFARNCLRGG